MLNDDLDRYIRFRRALGLTFVEQERLLRQFVRFADTRAAEVISTDHITAWAASGSSAGVARARFNVARAFAVFLNGEDPRHGVPAAGAFGRGRRRRPAPHILTISQIERIMAAALAVKGRSAISALTYHHLFGLLAATGLRVSEALALRCDDLTEDGLVIRSGKFGKSRLVPLHLSTRSAIERYLSIRLKIAGASDALFVVSHGGAPTKTRVHVVFVRIARALGFRSATGRGPRLHDLRHSFAVRSLEACAHDPRAVLRHMRALSTYLGHAEVANTYWYLEATPILLNSIAAATETAFAGATP